MNFRTMRIRSHSYGGRSLLPVSRCHSYGSRSLRAVSRPHTSVNSLTSPWRLLTEGRERLSKGSLPPTKGNGGRLPLEVTAITRQNAVKTASFMEVAQKRRLQRVSPVSCLLCGSGSRDLARIGRPKTTLLDE